MAASKVGSVFEVFSRIREKPGLEVLPARGMSPAADFGLRADILPAEDRRG